MATSRSVAPGNIRAELARRDLKQRHLAAALGITSAAVSQKLRGQRPITIDELEVIADYLGLQTDTLLVNHNPTGARSERVPA